MVASGVGPDPRVGLAGAGTATSDTARTVTTQRLGIHSSPEISAAKRGAIPRGRNTSPAAEAAGEGALAGKTGAGCNLHDRQGCGAQKLRGMIDPSACRVGAWRFAEGADERAQQMVTRQTRVAGQPIERRPRGGVGID